MSAIEDRKTTAREAISAVLQITTDDPELNDISAFRVALGAALRASRQVSSDATVILEELAIDISNYANACKGMRNGVILGTDDIIDTESIARELQRASDALYGKAQWHA